jgi:hypothetical protein
MAIKPTMTVNTLITSVMIWLRPLFSLPLVAHACAFVVSVLVAPQRLPAMFGCASTLVETRAGAKIAPAPAIVARKILIDLIISLSLPFVTFRYLYCDLYHMKGVNFKSIMLMLRLRFPGM